MIIIWTRNCYHSCRTWASFPYGWPPLGLAVWTCSLRIGPPLGPCTIPGSSSTEYDFQLSSFIIDHVTYYAAAQEAYLCFIVFAFSHVSRSDTRLLHGRFKIVNTTWTHQGQVQSSQMESKDKHRCWLPAVLLCAEDSTANIWSCSWNRASNGASNAWTHSKSKHFQQGIRKL